MARPTRGPLPLDRRVTFRLTTPELEALRAIAGGQELGTVLRRLIIQERTRRKTT